MTDQVAQQPLEEDMGLEEEEAASTTNRTEARAKEAKLKRRTLRQQSTTTGRRIEALIYTRGSRGAILGLLRHCDELLLRASLLQTELSALENDEEAERQDNLHLTYVTRVGETTEAAKVYLASREGEAASVIDFGGNVPAAPSVPPPEIQRREQAHREELAVAQQRCDEARERANRGREECDAAQAALRQLTSRPADPDQFSSVSQQVGNANPLVDEWISRQRRINGNTQETPDDWIEQYSAGLLPPVSNKLSARSAVSAELASYQGKSLEWFEWIDLFRALVHDTPKSPGEKLALLKRYLRDECLDVVYGLGGGETAYIQALVRLKETYGRRDVMRAAHLQALDRLELKGEAGAFKRFAERVRSHLFDLSRIGEMSAADVIEKICLKLNLQDRLAWNEERHGRLERRSLNDFGTWLCSRASAYQNAYSIAASQANSSAPVNKGFTPRRTRTHQASTKTHEGGSSMQSSKPFCFKCEKSHRLSDCEDFKALSIGEKIHFCMRRRLCFSCFSCKHSVRECPTSRPCKYAECRFTHHPLLHDPEKLPVKTVHPSTARAEKNSRVALGMLRLQVQGSDGSWCLANIFADEGSDTTLVRSAFATALKIRGSPQILTVDGAGGVVTSYPSELIHFQVRAESGEIVTLEGSTMQKVASPAPTTDWNKEKRRWPHLRDLPVGEVGGKVDVLIGTDHLHLLAARESREGEDYEPIASRTRLGWIIRGVTNRAAHALAVRSFIISGRTQLEQLTTEMRRFCDTEAFGTEYKQGCLSPDNQRAMALVKEKTKKLAVGYEVPIIWREGEPDLPNNRAMAVNRYQSLLRRFQHQPELERDYEAAMQKTLDKGYASRVEDPADAKYFLAHHGVYKGTKLRVVFDAAAHFRGKALNDAIIGGPALQPVVAAVITRFRQEDCAWASDIEAMFSRFRLAAEDARFFCFLWREKSSGDMVTYKMDRLPFGASCSPFVAIHTIQQIAKDAGVEENVAVAVRERMYVDDYLSSAPNISKAVQEASAVRNMLADADLNLQGWVSNSQDFLQQVATSAGTSSTNIHPLGSSGEEKVLGVFWDTDSDTLGFKVTELPDVKFTRMELASRVAGVFDPLGTASPIIVKAKIRLRMLGQSGLQWTDVVGEEDTSWWLLWFKELQCLNQVAMPRCLFPNRETLESSELHTFCDASEEAYAAVIYIRNVFSSGQVVIRQVKATNKLAPKKTISVPKLELNAALLGARVTQVVQQALPAHIHRRRFWTDSSTVRNWIRAAAANYQVFVSNRVGEIQTITDEDEWRFVPGRLNPADAATRSALDGDVFPAIWLNGPDFLFHPEDKWPVDLPWMTIKEEMRSIRVCFVAQTEKTDWSKVQITPRDIPQLCALEEKFLSFVRQCQEESFAEELNRLRKKKVLCSTSSLLALAPIMSEDGLLRLGGRAGRARLPYDQLHPPFLPGRHPFTEKVVVAFHQSLNHVGTDFLLSYIRQHFWVTKGREVVKKVRRDCVVCRRNRAQPGEQIMADLTESRLDFGSIPFTRAAVDLFGPLEIGLYRNKTAKRWSVLYTCLVTRAVFLELVPSLSSTDFLLSLRKFVAMYRSPEVLHSDNGTNFVGAERELRKAADALYASEELPKYMQASRIKWTFQPPRTPHFGGAHESLVKSTKRALYNALEQEKGDFRYPTEDLLRTLLYEVAGLLNTRPLTYASSDPSDFRPLTPNDFLNRAPTAYPPAGLYSEAQPRDHYRYLQRTLNLFWDIWKTVYLQSLAARKKWQTRRPNLEIGDVVLEINKGFERGVWSIGHVVQVFPGPDGCVRAVDVQLPSGIFRRGITELCLLENNSAVPASGEDVSAKSR